MTIDSGHRSDYKIPTTSYNSHSNDELLDLHIDPTVWLSDFYKMCIDAKT